jgi:hypothetical protein|tara:strand:+ start:1591 stop:2493 length:903 start_codon:yes stop_codon:yes gene_type:complete
MTFRKIRNSGNKYAKTFIKLAITISAFLFVLDNIEFRELALAFGGTNLWFFFPALLFFNISKLTSAFRLNHFFSRIGLAIPSVFNIKLYYICMFYSFFFPGGIGGDGYKIFVLQRDYDVKASRVLYAIFWDRIIGVAVLIILTSAFFITSSLVEGKPLLLYGALVLFTLTFPIVWFGTKYLQGDFAGILIKTSFESLIVQVSQMISAFFIFFALGLRTEYIDYLTIFLISSVIAFVPITIGGAGAREVTFLYFLRSIKLDPSIGIVTSTVFFSIAVLSSLPSILINKTLPVSSEMRNGLY